MGQNVPKRRKPSKAPNVAPSDAAQTPDAPVWLPIEQLKSRLIALSHAAAPASSQDPETEPHASVREILWALFVAIEKGDQRALKDLHKPAAKYLLANSDWSFDFATTEVTSRTAFASYLVASISGMRADPFRLGPDDFSDVFKLTLIMLRGARIFREIRDLGEAGVHDALKREFGDARLDTERDPQGIADRALKAVGIPAKVRWDIFFAAQAARDRRDREKEVKKIPNT